MRGTGLLLSALGVVLLGLGPLGTRAGLSFTVGFLLVALGLIAGLAGASLSFAAGIRTGEWLQALPGILLGGVVVGVPASALLGARGAPPIHDVTTDTADPPAFVAVRPLRADAPNPPEYDGAETAAHQRVAYPDIAPVVLPLERARAFARARAVVHELGWEVVGEDDDDGRIEAVDTSFWFGFKDDVVVRLRQVSDGTRVDVRSKSRVGLGDMGANARRVRAFLRRVHDPN